MVVFTITEKMKFIKELNMFIQGTATLLEKLLTKDKEHSHNVFQVTRRSRNEVKPLNCSEILWTSRLVRRRNPMTDGSLV